MNPAGSFGLPTFKINLKYMFLLEFQLAMRFLSDGEISQ